VAFSLEAIFGVDASGVRATMKSLRRDLNDFVSDWAKIGAGAAVGAFVALSKGAVDLAGRLSDASQNLGINVEALQALEAQHKRNGISSDQLATTLGKLRMAVEKSREGDEKSTVALQKLGLSWQILAALPLEKKYEAVARGLRNSTDQAGAYNAISDIFGERVGPKLIASLNELAEQGYPKVAAEAQKAGLVMSAETIAALDKAGDAIDDFKRKATMAIGNIIVNFRSEEGIKLLGMQFMRVLAQFGGGIVDAIVESGQMVWAVLRGAFTGVVNVFQNGLVEAMKYVATAINTILPASWQINIAGLDQLKTTGEAVADSISRAIAETSPSTFKKDFTSFWDKAIADQQKVVDAINKIDLKPEADKLRDSGKKIEASLVTAADKLSDAGRQAGASIKEAAQALSIAMGRSGTPYESASTASLEGTLARLNQQLQQAKSQVGYGNYNTNYGATVQGQTIEAEIRAIQTELRQRAAVQNLVERTGSDDAARRRYGDDITDRGLRDMQDSSTRTAASLQRIEDRLTKIFGNG
jgi:hypothetical protein